MHDALDAVGVVVLGDGQARVAGRDAAPHRRADVLGDVDRDDRRDRRHDLARLLLVQVKDAGEHARLARVEVAAGVRLGDDRAHLLGARALLEVVVALDAQRAQQRARGLVEQVDERPHDPVEEVQRPRAPARHPLGVDDRVDLRHLLARRDVAGGDEDVGDRDRDRAPRRRATGRRARGSTRSAIAGSPRKPMPSEASVMPNWQADRYSLMSSSCLTTILRLAVALGGHLLDPGALRAHERELGRDEEAVEEDQHDDRAEQERDQEGWLRPGLGCRPRLRGRSSFIDAALPRVAADRASSARTAVGALRSGRRSSRPARSRSR